MFTQSSKIRKCMFDAFYEWIRKLWENKLVVKYTYSMLTLSRRNNKFMKIEVLDSFSFWSSMEKFSGKGTVNKIKKRTPPTNHNIQNYRRETRQMSFFMDVCLFYLILKTSERCNNFLNSYSSTQFRFHIKIKYLWV